MGGVSSGRPQRVRGPVGIEHHRIDANGPSGAQPLLGNGEQPASDAAAAVVRVDSEAVKMRAPSIPIHDQAAEDALPADNEQHRVGISCDQSLDDLPAIDRAIAVLSCQTPEAQDGVDIVCRRHSNNGVADRWRRIQIPGRRQFAGKHDTTLAWTRVVGYLADLHPQGSVKRYRAGIRRNRDGFDLRAATRPGQSAEGAVQPASVSAAPLILAHGHDMHVAQSLRRNDDPEEICGNPTLAIANNDHAESPNSSMTIG